MKNKLRIEDLMNFFFEEHLKSETPNYINLMDYYAGRYKIYGDILESIEKSQTKISEKQRNRLVRKRDNSWEMLKVVS